jgi:hypothetical protein
MNRTRTIAAAGAAALLGVAALAGCSSSSESTEADGDSTQMLPPVIITDDQTSATCAVGDYLDIVIPEDQLIGTTVDSSDSALVSVTQAKEEGDALFNPGGQCLSAGDATITVTGPSGSSREIALTISQ